MASKTKLSEFLDAFPNTLQHGTPEIPSKSWYFWTKDEGCKENLSSADLGTPVIQDKIISAFSNTVVFYSGFIAQFWAPVTIGGRRVLSTSCQPFVVSDLSDRFSKYRLNSAKYKYNIDVNNVDIEGDPMIKSGGPATAFLNCLPYANQLEWLPPESCFGLRFSVMIPICFPFKNYCIGVLECASASWSHYLGFYVLDTIKALKKVGLDVFYVQGVIPYKTINGLKFAKDEIREALKVVCESHNLALAQVWVAYEDNNHVLLSSSFEDAQKNRLLAIKLVGYHYYSVPEEDEYDPFGAYSRSCDLIPRGNGEELARETLQDYESRYISKLSDMLVEWDGDLFCRTSAFAICLRSNDTGEFKYAFEFTWIKHPNYVIFLEAILLTLKRSLPKFKFASGVVLGDELDVSVVESSNHGIEKLKIFQGKRSSSMSEALEGEKSTILDYIAPSQLLTCKTTPILLPREVIEKQFGKPMKEAAKNLSVSLSTLKRKFKELGIVEWPGPNFMKKNANSSFITQINTNEEHNEAIQDPSTDDTNKNILTVKAAYEDEMIKFHLPISQATFITVKKQIGMKLKLRTGNYKLKYLDEDGDWISLISEESMTECIKSLKKIDRNVVQVCVQPSTQSISAPSDSNTSVTSTFWKSLEPLSNYSFD